MAVPCAVRAAAGWNGCWTVDHDHDVPGLRGAGRVVWRYLPRRRGSFGTGSLRQRLPSLQMQRMERGSDAGDDHGSIARS